MDDARIERDVEEWFNPQELGKMNKIDATLGQMLFTPASWKALVLLARTQGEDTQGLSSSLLTNMSTKMHHLP